MIIEERITTKQNKKHKKYPIKLVNCLSKLHICRTADVVDIGDYGPSRGTHANVGMTMKPQKNFTKIPMQTELRGIYISVHRSACVLFWILFSIFGF